MFLGIPIFVIGLAILIGAIIINVFVSSLGMSTWFTFMAVIQEEGFRSALSSTSFLSLLFLFILYPFLLGLIAYVSYKGLDLIGWL